MRRWLPLLLLLAGCRAATAPAPAAPRELAGVLTGTTVIAGEAVLAADVLVPEGSELIIRAGATVWVRPATGTKIDPEYLSSATELLVRGQLRIEGTAAAPVEFVVLAAAGAEDRTWAGIALVDAADSSIVGARIAGAETGILCLRSSPLLAANRLVGCRYGIIAQDRSAPVILDNLIEGGEGGIFCWLGSSPEIRGNRIIGQDEEGIFVDGTSRPRIDANEIAGTAIGLVAPVGFPRPAGVFTDNREDVRRLGELPGGGR